MQHDFSVIHIDGHFVKLFPDYLESRVELVEAIAAAIGAEDWDLVSSSAHKLVGSPGLRNFERGKALSSALVAGRRRLSTLELSEHVSQLRTIFRTAVVDPIDVDS